MSGPVLAPHVLYVDDGEIMREVWPLLLAPMGFDVVTADSGRRALHLARLRRPDVIVTDMVMPEMSGIDLFHALRLEESSLNVAPVIFMTSGTFPFDRPQNECWLEKSISPEQLATKIRSLLA